MKKAPHIRSNVRRAPSLLRLSGDFFLVFLFIAHRNCNDLPNFGCSKIFYKTQCFVAAVRQELGVYGCTILVWGNTKMFRYVRELIS